MSASKNPFKNPFMHWMQDRLPIFGEGHHFLMTYPTPKNLNYWWNFGVLAIFMLVVMILTGLFLAMHYQPSVDEAFQSVDRIMRDVNFGWLIRYIHMNGASFFFIVVYIHIFRGMYYGSYKAPREMLWILGCLILLLMIATAFLGYTLPWGQMSFWGAKVITSLFTAIPAVGDDILLLLQGAPSLDTPALNRFFVLHFLLPFVILGVVGLHILALHSYGSNNPLGIDMQGPQDSISFHPYYTTEKVFTLGLFLALFAVFIFFMPEKLSHTINNVEANSLVTPAHIVPEWYLLTFYAILRSITFDFLFIDAKLLGVLMMGGAIAVLFLMPWLDTSKVRSAKFRPIFRISFWVFLLVAYCLGIVGALTPDESFKFYWPILSWFFGVPALDTGIRTLYVGQFMTAMYFAYFLVLLPLLGFVEKTKPLPAGIAQPVPAE